MMLEKTRMIKHREKGQTYTKNKNNKLQNKRTLTTELKQQMDLKNANKDLSTNIASNTLKKNGKNKENTNKHTHRTERNNTVKHTHTENQKLRGKHAHTQEAATNQCYLFRTCTKTTANSSTRAHDRGGGSTRDMCDRLPCLL